MALRFISQPVQVGDTSVLELGQWLKVETNVENWDGYPKKKVLRSKK